MFDPAYEPEALYQQEVTAYGKEVADRRRIAINQAADSDARNKKMTTLAVAGVAAWFLFFRKK